MVQRAAQGINVRADIGLVGVYYAAARGLDPHAAEAFTGREDFVGRAEFKQPWVFLGTRDPAAVEFAKSPADPT